MSVFRSLNDEKGNPEELYYSEEEATAAYRAYIRMAWHVRKDGKWEPWAPPDEPGQSGASSTT